MALRELWRRINGEAERDALMRGFSDGWDAGCEAAAKMMEDRKVSASAFYAKQIRSMKRDEE